MSEAVTDSSRESSDFDQFSRGFRDRHPVVSAVVVTELIVLAPAALFIWLGDPFATSPNTFSLVGALLVVVALVIGVISVTIFVGILVLRIVTR